MLEVLSDTVIYFVLYAFIGWISEVIYAAYEEKRFVNRGFLPGLYVLSMDLGLF